MNKHLNVLCLFFMCILHGFSQSPMLVQDYFPGPQGALDGRIYEFKHVLLFEGVSQAGEHAILQYDKNTDEITPLITDNDVEGEISRISVTSDQVIIITKSEAYFRHIYRSFENDLSDLELIYETEEEDITINLLRTYRGNFIIAEFGIEYLDYVNNIKVIHEDGSVAVLFENLTYYPLEINFSSIDGHYIIGHRSELIDDKYILAYDLESRLIVPFTNIDPNYQDCGFMQRFGTIYDDIFYYQCDEDYIYDLESEQSIEFEEDIFLLAYNTEDQLFVAGIDALYKIDKNTFESEVVMENLRTFRGNPNVFLALSGEGDFLDISLFDYENEMTYSYPTNLHRDSIYRFTGFAEVQSGIHTVIYDLFANTGILTRINPESYEIVDSVFNVNFNNRPVAYDEDIYFTHEDPEVGNELFWIDYEVSSIQNIDLIANLRITPNPSHDYIQIEHPNDWNPISLSIFDMNGNLVRQSFKNDRVDVRNLPSGIYLSHSRYTNGESLTKQFVVK